MARVDDVERQQEDGGKMSLGGKKYCGKLQTPHL